MTGSLDSLYWEHANLAKLLGILERKLARIERGETVDFDLVQTLIDYFLDYPDACHHPKEDVIFRRLVAVKPAAAAEIGDLDEEHASVAQAARELADAVTRVTQDAEIPRDWFRQVGRAFVDTQRRHIEMENTRFFPIARRELGPEDWAAIDAKIDNRSDPLFGEDVAREYEELRAAILEWDAENSDPPS